MLTFFSQILLKILVIYRLVIRGFWKALETSDLWLLRKEETVDFNRNVFAPRWEPVLAQWREEQAALEAKKKQNAPPETATNPRVDATNPEANGKRTPSPQQSAEKTKEDEKKEKEEAEKKKKKEEENKPKPPLMMMLMKVYGPMLMVSQLINLIYVVALFCNPLLLWYDLVALVITHSYTVRLYEYFSRYSLRLVPFA